MENGVPKSIVLGGRDDRDAPGSGMLPGVLRSLNIAGVTPKIDLNQSIDQSINRSIKKCHAASGYCCAAVSTDDERKTFNANAGLRT